MNNIYLLQRRHQEYDMLNNMVVVAKDSDHAKEIFAVARKSTCDDVDAFLIDRIGETEKTIGTVILEDY